jgi:hypothetical protein
VRVGVEGGTGELVVVDGGGDGGDGGVTRTAGHGWLARLTPSSTSPSHTLTAAWRHAAAAAAGVARARLQALLPVRVVNAALVLVGQHLVRLGHSLEHLVVAPRAICGWQRGVE